MGDNEKQYKRQNKFIADNYDRVSVTLPKSTKERIKAQGETLNGFINRVVLSELRRMESGEGPQAPETTQKPAEGPRAYTWDELQAIQEEKRAERERIIRERAEIDRQTAKSYEQENLL